MSDVNSLFSNDEMDVKQKIVQELISNNNLEKKTELSNPLRWSCLTMIQEFILNHNLKQSSSILARFTETAFRYLISKERKGRVEYVEALKELEKADKDKPLSVK